MLFLLAKKEQSNENWFYQRVVDIFKEVKKSTSSSSSSRRSSTAKIKAS